MCHSIADQPLQQDVTAFCNAKLLGPDERLVLGLEALAGHQSITDLAEEAGVSRKFVHGQANIAQAALEDAFTPSPADDEVLFHLPVTKNRVTQVVLGLILIGHSSYRGVQEFCRDLLHYDISVGTVHNIVHEAIAKARLLNQQQNLANVDVAGLDEIFQNQRPILVGADIHSSYCFLLSAEDKRDGDTWALSLLECQDRGLNPSATIADFGAGIRAGVDRALPGKPCRGDVFHVVYDTQIVVHLLENRAYEAMAAHDKRLHKRTKLQREGRRNQSGQLSALSRQVAFAAAQQDQAISLADDMGILSQWLRDDVLAVSGLPYAERVALFDFILAECQSRIPLYATRLAPLCTMLRNQRDQILAFAWQLEQDLKTLAAEFEVPLDTVRELLDLQRLEPHWPRYWQKQAALRQVLRSRFHLLEQAVRELSQRVVRASSIVENINSRLRNYFFLRREVGSDYLQLLQFFLNHRRFLRSEREERVDKSPAELLTGQPHPHWLSLLGYRPFSPN